jgi:hypothetical protein
LINFDALAEQRIVEAIERGELDGLPGSGRPLDLQEDALVPAEVRVAHRILKNAGLAPAEVLERRELAELESKIRKGGSPTDRVQVLGRLVLLRAHMEARRMHRSASAGGYTAKLMEKLSRSHGA